MVGDVSSHGYRAAIIMALAMSATAIHAQESDQPAETLAAVQRSLHEELETTEMFITAFYGVVDTWGRELRWANMGHPHAFVIGPEGRAERLSATDLPMGMMTSPPRGSTRPWRPGEDVLLLFTDGISDARNRVGARFGEEPVLRTVIEHRGESSDEIAARVWERLEAFTGEVARQDDLTLLILKS
jgi:sigma-B regulation protein RsbU (phosphoserine phosphatase)